MGVLGGVIRDGAQHFGASLEMVANGPMAALALRMGVAVPPLSVVAENAPALPIAYISHSRLVADCPDCNGAEFVWRDGPHVIMCQSCWNGAIGGKWRPVLMHPALPEVEAILAERPLPQTRSWYPRETIEQLREENRERL